MDKKMRVFLALLLNLLFPGLGFYFTGRVHDRTSLVIGGLVVFAAVLVSDLIALVGGLPSADEVLAALLFSVLFGIGGAAVEDAFS